MDDALEILDDIQRLLDNHADLFIIQEYVNQKYREFQPSCGDCCG